LLSDAGVLDAADGCAVSQLGYQLSSLGFTPWHSTVESRI